MVCLNVPFTSVAARIGSHPYPLHFTEVAVQSLTRNARPFSGARVRPEWHPRLITQSLIVHHIMLASCPFAANLYLTCTLIRDAKQMMSCDVT